MKPVAPGGLRLSLACQRPHTTGAPPSTTSPIALNQRRILLTNAKAPGVAAKHRRSPYQWSHITHRIRKPVTPAMVATAEQTRGHAGHGHHHHHHDNTYLTSKNKSDPGVRITRIGLYVNLGMAVVKGAGGYVFNSQALTADAVHALTDLVSDITTLATISYSLKPPTARFPQGYGKIESLGALGVSSLLLMGGIGIGVQALTALAMQFAPGFADLLSHLAFLGHSHSHGGGDEHVHGVAETIGPNINAAWLAGGSIIVKEWLYRSTNKIAQEKRSSVLASNAYHHRVDSLTAFVALTTILASRFLEGAAWLDPVGGLVISGMIVQAGWGNTTAALLELADVGMDEDVRVNVRKTVEGVVGRIVGVGAGAVRGVQGIKSGQNFLVEVEVAVPQDWSLVQGDELKREIRDAVGGKVKGVRKLSVRVVPQGMDEGAFEDMFIARENQSEVEEHNDHDHDHNHDHVHTNGSTKQAAPVASGNDASNAIKQATKRSG